MGRVLFGAKRDPATFWRILDGVVDEIDQHLEELIAFALHFNGYKLRVHTDLPRLRKRRIEFDRISTQSIQRDAADVIWNRIELQF